MRRIASLLLTLAVSWTSLTQAETTLNNNMPARELPDLVFDLLPSDGWQNLGWDYMVNDPGIAWQTTGVKSVGDRGHMRTGFARVKVVGVFSKVLRKTWEELPWSVTLVTDGLEKFGPKGILVVPGSLEPTGSTADSYCFGTLVSGCTFTPDQAFKSSRLQKKFVCAFYKIQDETQVYVVAAIGKTPSLVTYEKSGGSGGESSSLFIQPLSELSGVCKPPG